MSYSWGNTPLQIVVGSIKLDNPPSLTENPLLPDPAALSEKSTVLQQQGRKRSKVGARLCVSSMAEYNAYVADKDSGVNRTLVIEISDISNVYIIETVGEPEDKRWDMFFFDITWMEV